ncbi:hypothetical protein SPSYN_01005 [Sporotomaculum syntrophicum]|uniref:Uncharacterized protein n=1 Tax=Sporotomaculum syntrophicum TaxID=182264 RepID=A0A9D3AZ79_9FIRM|nr:hypothetical protein [Sporotomaculum syntrophicum]KAF1086261.1 hypothetical protein SPSYN_01005 [Sporotomaculum syntrophicum]
MFLQSNDGSQLTHCLYGIVTFFANGVPKPITGEPVPYSLDMEPDSGVKDIAKRLARWTRRRPRMYAWEAPAECPNRDSVAA